LEEGLRVDAVFAHNDEMILGAIEAFEATQTPKSSVMIGFDATPDALEAITHQDLTATIAQQPEEMGWQAVQTAVLIFREEQVPASIFVDLELIIKK
jgi:ribose transport system substrate-binding protein